MSIDLSYYDDKYPLNHDSEQYLQGSKCTIGKHTYGIELITVQHYDPTAAFHVGRFCSIAHTEFYLGGSKNTNSITTAFFIPKFFSNSTHDSDMPVEQIEKRPSGNSIYVGNDVWIGNRSTIMHGVVIGNGAVIAANSHVVTNVPAYAIFGGNPAKLINYRFPSETISLLNQLAWWELDDSVINQLFYRLKQSPKSIGNEVKELINEVSSMQRSNSFVDQWIEKFTANS